MSEKLRQRIRSLGGEQRDLKSSKQRVLLLQALLKDDCWGYELAKSLGMRPDTVYANLILFLKLEIVSCNTVKSSERRERKLYNLTEEGRHFAISFLEDWQIEQAIKDEAFDVELSL